MHLDGNPKLTRKTIKWLMLGPCVEMSYLTCQNIKHFVCEVYHITPGTAVMITSQLSRGLGVLSLVRVM